MFPFKSLQKLEGNARILFLHDVQNQDDAKGKPESTEAEGRT